MAVLTASIEIPRKEAGLQSYPCGVDIIYKGGFVGINAAGYAVAMPIIASAAGLKFVGIAYEKVDNSAGSAGDKSVRVYTQGTFKVTATSITQAMVGQMMYLVDDQTVDDIASAICIPVGRLVEWVSETKGWVDIGQRGSARSVVCLVPHILMSTIADGDVVTNFIPGFAGRVLKTFWIQDVPVTTPAKLTTLNLEIGAVNLTGGEVALTSALCTPKGKYIAGAAITALNAFLDTDTISVEASGTTAFVEGSGSLYAVLESFEGS